VEPVTGVITVLDTVVVRVVATGEERTWTFPGAVYDPRDPSYREVVTSVVWQADRVVATVDGHLVTLDPDQSATPDSAAGPAIQLVDGDATYVGLIAARRDGEIVACAMIGDRGTGRKAETRVLLLDAATGKELRELARLDGWLGTDGDPTGDHWATTLAGQVLIDGQPLALDAPAVEDGTTVKPSWAGW
jgi:hypothetical protein